MALSIAINGLALGFVYALLSMGLVLLIRASGVMNFAQGDLLSVGAYVTFFLTTSAGLPLIPMLLVSILIICAFAGVFFSVCYLPVRKNKWFQTKIVCTMGASVVIKESLQLIFGAKTRNVPPIIKGTTKILGARLQNQYLVIVGACLIVLLMVYILFEKLYCGKIMQAASQNPYAAAVIGIPATLTILLTYMIVFTIAGVAGWLVVPTYTLSVGLNTFQLRAFAGLVIGGFGDLRGAIIGSLLVGLLEACGSLVTTTYKDVIVYGLLLIVLIIRPQGLFASRQGVKV